VKRLEHALFVYSTGFAEMLHEQLAQSNMKERLAGLVWAAFLLLLDKAETGLDKQGALAQVIQDHSEKLAHQRSMSKLEADELDRRLSNARRDEQTRSAELADAEGREAVLSEELGQQRQVEAELRASLLKVSSKLKKAEDQFAKSERRVEAAQRLAAPMNELRFELRQMKLKMTDAEVRTLCNAC
jgi:chromosome segregation ATPase